MDERVILARVDKVLKPYLANAPEHVIPILILDSYRCHIMALVGMKIQELGIEVKHIPGGCTGIVGKDFSRRSHFLAHLIKAKL
jgi:hypothetical protein